MECWLPDLRRVLPKLRLLRSNEELFAAIAEALADAFAKDVVSVAVDSYLGEECAETAFVRVE